MKLRVCYGIDPPFLGGAEKYVADLACALAPERFAAAVVMREPRDRRLRAWADELTTRGVDVTAIPLDLTRRPWDAFAYVRAVRRTRADIVHLNLPGPYDAQMGLLAPLSRWAGARAVVTTEHLPMVPPTPRRRPVKRFAYRSVDTVVTVCAANVPHLTGPHGVDGDRVRVVHNGIPRASGTAGFGPRAEAIRARVGVRDDECLVVFVGNLLPHKGLVRLAEALSQIREAHWRLAVVGDGPDREPSEAVLRASGLAGRATYFGAVPSEEVPAILAASDLLSLPSAIEGLPYVIMEAMAASLPVVSTPVAGIPEMVADGETGLLVAPDDVAGLSAALATLIDRPELRKEFGARARRRFEDHFTLEKQVAVMETLYRELAGDGRGGEGA